MIGINEDRVRRLINDQAARIERDVNRLLPRRPRPAPAGQVEPIRCWYIDPFTSWREPEHLDDVDRAWIDAQMAVAGRQRYPLAERVGAFCDVALRASIRITPIDDDGGTGR